MPFPALPSSGLSKLYQGLKESCLAYILKYLWKYPKLEAEQPKHVVNEEPDDGKDKYEYK